MTIAGEYDFNEFMNYIDSFKYAKLSECCHVRTDMSGRNIVCRKCGQSCETYNFTGKFFTMSDIDIHMGKARQLNSPENILIYKQTRNYATGEVTFCMRPWAAGKQVFEILSCILDIDDSKDVSYS